MIMRLLQNAFDGWFQLSKRFPAPLLDEVARLVSQGEQTHNGEVRVAIEARLPLSAVLGGVTASRRAHEVFAHLRVWDTEHNNGVLLYVLLAEHSIEIVADRGIARRVGTDEWKSICQQMREGFARDDWRGGLLRGVEQANALLRQHFPTDGSHRTDELPDHPIIL
jgi:TPM domain